MKKRTTSFRAKFALGVAGALVAATSLVGASLAQASPAAGSVIGSFHTISAVGSTVPRLGQHSRGNGDVNPYGVAVVPRSVGDLVRGDVLVSNFNNSANEQGTGRTIMQISPEGRTTVFADLAPQVSGPIGLTTALSVFRNGDVVVGSLPTTNGSPATARAGALYILNANGHVIETLKGTPDGFINGPWDMTSFDEGGFGVLFVANVLNGTVAAAGSTVHDGTVVRIVLDLTTSPPKVIEETVIASGFGERTDPNALVIGETGLALSPNGTLYVADTLASRLAAVPGALFRASSSGTGRTVARAGSLNGPLGAAVAPNGDIVTVNSGDGLIVETTPAGRQLDTLQLDSSGAPPGAGALFGLAVKPGGTGVYFVDDAINTLELLH